MKAGRGQKTLCLWCSRYVDFKGPGRNCKLNPWCVSTAPIATTFHKPKLLKPQRKVTLVSNHILCVVPSSPKHTLVQGVSLLTQNMLRVLGASSPGKAVLSSWVSFQANFSPYLVPRVAFEKSTRDCFLSSMLLFEKKEKNHTFECIKHKVDQLL